MIYTPHALRDDDGRIVMKSVRDRPPNYAAILEVVPYVKFRRGMLYAWANVLFNPDDVRLTPELWEHEYTHSRQQGQTPSTWWARYLVDIPFRFVQEAEAHSAEIVTVLERSGNALTKKTRRLIVEIRDRMHSPIYAFSPSQLEIWDAETSWEALGAQDPDRLEKVREVGGGAGGATRAGEQAPQHG